MKRPGNWYRRIRQGARHRPRPLPAIHPVLGREIRRDQPLLTVLAAADVEEIGAVRDLFPEADRTIVEPDPAPGCSSLEDGDIATVGVDVQVVRVQVSDQDPHAMERY